MGTRLYFFLILISSELPAIRSDLRGYDCSDTSIISTYPATNLIPNCESHDNTFSYIQLGTIIQKDVSIKSVLVYQCFVRYNESLEGSSHLMSAWTEELLNREDCLKAHESKQIKRHGRIIDLKPAGTIRKRFYFADGKPVSDRERYEKVREYEIRLTTFKATVDEDQIVKIENITIGCNYEDFQCGYQGGLLFWKQVPDDCELDYSSVYSGIVQMVSFHPGRQYAVFDIEGYQIVLNAGKGWQPICGKIAFATDSNWFIVDGLDDSFRQTGFDIKLFANVYYEKRSDYVTNSAEDVARRNCKADGDNRAAILKKMAEARKSWLAFGEGTILELVGTNVEMKKCRQVSVKLRIADKCYKEIPVFDESGDEAFLRRDSMILVYRSDVVPCMGQASLESSWNFGDFVHCIGAFCSVVWITRKFVGFIKYLFYGNAVRTELVNEANHSKLRKLFNQFLALLNPPFQL